MRLGPIVIHHRQAGTTFNDPRGPTTTVDSSEPAFALSMILVGFFELSRTTGQVYSDGIHAGQGPLETLPVLTRYPLYRSVSAAAFVN